MASFAKPYPTTTRWVEEYGWIEVGADEYSNSLARALDPGGIVWESNPEIDSINEALNELEEELKKWFKKNG